MFSKENFYMKKPRFTDSQIMDVLKQVKAGLSVPEICRELGLSVAMFPCAGRQHFGKLPNTFRARPASPVRRGEPSRVCRIC